MCFSPIPKVCTDTHTHIDPLESLIHSKTQMQGERNAVLKDHNKMQILMFLSQRRKNPQFSIKSDLQ